MKSLVIIAAIATIAYGADGKVYNFNSVDYCSRIGYHAKVLDSNDRATVIFREPTSNLGSSLNKLFNTIPDRCSMTFGTALITSKRQMQVRFDSMRRKINTNGVTIAFYDDNSVRASKKIMEVSKAKPVGQNNTFTTTSGYLTIEVNRDFENARDYNIEMIIEPVGSATAAKWSCVTATLMLVIGYIL